MESEANRKPINIGLPGSLLLIPLLFVAAGVSIPFSLVQRRLQRRRELKSRLELAVRGRIIDWRNFVQKVNSRQGTVIEERYSLKGPDRWWWTSEKVRDLAPYKMADWPTMLEDGSFRLFADWCRQQYTDMYEGRALLVVTDGAPRDEVRATLSRMRLEAEDGIWIEVVPPESIRKP